MQEAARIPEAARPPDAPRYAGLFGRDDRTPESFWISLRGRWEARQPKF